MEVGFELACAWDAPLDVIVPRKIGAPHDPELAVGALTEDGEVVLDERLSSYFDLSRESLQALADSQKKEISRRLRLYRDGAAPIPISDRVVVLTDDGIATGATMKAAVLSARNKKAKEIYICVPVASAEAVRMLENLVDQICVLEIPDFFMAVGQFYQNFEQTSDEKVVELLKISRKRKGEKGNAQENPSL